MPSSGAATFWMNERPPVDPLRARSVPMLLAALGFAAGILSARQWHSPVALICDVAAAFCFAAISVHRRGIVGWLAVLGAWMAAGCWCAQMQRPVDRQVAVREFADGLSRTVQGRVLAIHSLPPKLQLQGSPKSPVEPWLVEPGAWEGDHGEPTQTLDLALDSVEDVTPEVASMRPIAGGLRLTLTGNSLPLHCGDVVSVPVRLRVPEVYRDPGAFSYQEWLLEQGVVALGTASASSVQEIRHGAASATCLVLGAQHWAASRLGSLPGSAALRSLPEPVRLTNADAAILSAMLFGDRTRLSEAQRAGFERTGTFHLLVVSGFHVALVTGVLFWFLRKASLPEFAAVIVTLALALLYALVTGLGVPAQRALAMSSLYLVASALDRERSGLNALGIASLLILVADPRALYEPGFQMTALVILAVAGVAVPVQRRLLGSWRAVAGNLHTTELDAFLHPCIAARRVQLRMWAGLLRDLAGVDWFQAVPLLGLRLLLTVAEAAVLSVVVELCMALPMAMYFHRLAPMALPANLLVSPLACALVGSAVVMFALGLVSAWLAMLPALVTAALLHTTTACVQHLASSNLGDLRAPSPSATAVALCCCLLVGALWMLRARRPMLVRAGGLALVLLPLVALWPVPPLLHPGALEVTAIDVGQGDSLLVVSPGGQTMLVDAGGPVGRVTTKWDVGEQVVAPYLWSRRLRRLDVVVITHGHSDHIGGMPAILRDFHPRELWLSLAPAESAAMRSLLQTAGQMGIRVRWLAAGDTVTWDGLQAAALSPQRGYANYGEARNDDSLVLQLDWKEASVLLEGDAEAPSEAAMVAGAHLRPVTLLKVGHHGSRTSTTPEFLAAVRPKDALISVGKQNTFGHPRWEVLDRLEAQHVRTFRTDRAGATTFLLQADGSIAASEAYN